MSDAARRRPGPGWVGTEPAAWTATSPPAPVEAPVTTDPAGSPTDTPVDSAPADPAPADPAPADPEAPVDPADHSDGKDDNGPDKHTPVADPTDDNATVPDPVHVADPPSDHVPSDPPDGPSDHPAATAAPAVTPPRLRPTCRCRRRRPPRRRCRWLPRRPRRPCRRRAPSRPPSSSRSGYSGR